MSEPLSGLNRLGIMSLATSTAVMECRVREGKAAHHDAGGAVSRECHNGVETEGLNDKISFHATFLDSSSEILTEELSADLSSDPREGVRT